MILKEFTVDAEAAVVVEVEGVGVAVGWGLRSGRPGRRWVVGLSCWCWRRGSGVGCWSGERFFGLGKWRVRSGEWRVICGKSRFLTRKKRGFGRRLGGPGGGLLGLGLGRGGLWSLNPSGLKTGHDSLNEFGARFRQGTVRRRGVRLRRCAP